MAIITLAETKTILQISSTTDDSLISALIPQAQGTFLLIRGIPWFEIEADITTGSAVIDNILNSDLRKVSTSAYLEATGIDGSTLVENVNSVDSSRVNITENNIVMSAVATATTENLLIRLYPPGSKLATAKIIGYYLDEDSSSQYKSEQNGNYNYDKFDNNTGIPLSIAKLIKPYQSTHR